MQVERIVAHGVMEGEGAYNKHATMPADGAALASPLLEQAVRGVHLFSSDDPIVVADYGSSQGKNSQAPIRVAIRGIRQRVQPERAIFVFHIDQPSNDFNSLFEVLNSDTCRYTVNDRNVFPCAIGRSFYEQVLPPDSVHLGWSCFAAVWLSRLPSLIPGHFFPACCTGAARDGFEKQAGEDWCTFLRLRARELRTGGRLVIVLPALSEAGFSPFQVFMDHANAALSELVDDGIVTAEERSQMALATYARRKSELFAPFHIGERFERLIVENFAECELPDRAWAEYQVDDDRESLARRQARFFRAVFTPSLASILIKTRNGDCDAPTLFADHLQDRLTRRLIEYPTQTSLLVQTIVLAKS